MERFQSPGSGSECRIVEHEHRYPRKWTRSHALRTRKTSRIPNQWMCFLHSVPYDRSSKRGIQNDRLHLLAAWTDAPVFSVRERAALQWTEALTSSNARNEIRNGDYELVKENFSDLEIAHLTAAIALINAWNRIAKAYQFTPILTDCKATYAINQQDQRTHNAR